MFPGMMQAGSAPLSGKGAGRPMTPPGGMMGAGQGGGLPQQLMQLLRGGGGQVPAPAQTPLPQAAGQDMSSPFSGDVSGEAMRRAQGFQQQTQQPQRMGFGQALRTKGSNANILGSTAQGALQGAQYGGVPGAVLGGAAGFFGSGGGKKLEGGIKKLFSVF